MCEQAQLNWLHSCLAIVYTVFYKCEKSVSDKNAFKVSGLTARVYSCAHKNGLYGTSEFEFRPDVL